jgi:hypothetical protein
MTELYPNPKESSGPNVGWLFRAFIEMKMKRRKYVFKYSHTDTYIIEWLILFICIPSIYEYAHTDTHTQARTQPFASPYTVIQTHPPSMNGLSFIFVTPVCTYMHKYMHWYEYLHTHSKHKYTIQARYRRQREAPAVPKFRSAKLNFS